MLQLVSLDPARMQRRCTMRCPAQGNLSYGGAVRGLGGKARKYPSLIFLNDVIVLAWFRGVWGAAGGGFNRVPIIPQGRVAACSGDKPTWILQHCARSFLPCQTTRCILNNPTPERRPAIADSSYWMTCPRHSSRWPPSYQTTPSQTMLSLPIPLDLQITSITDASVHMFIRGARCTQPSHIQTPIL